jgi:hypothetical protein
MSDAMSRSNKMENDSSFSPDIARDSLKHTPKRVVFFPLENILIPGPFVEKVDVSKTNDFLNAFSVFAKKNGISFFLLSAYPEAIAAEKISEYKLGRFFPKENVYAVNENYLNEMQPIDRSRYDAKLKTNPSCTDEYYRQVAMLEIMKTHTYAKEDCVLVGSDYWFDGFYTRRYAQVDVAFVESFLSSRGKPIAEKISGLWYFSLEMNAFTPFVKGTAPPPRYQSLETWASLTLTEELLGTQNFNMVKRVILEKKKDGTLHPIGKGETTPPLEEKPPSKDSPSTPSDEINPSVM